MTLRTLRASFGGLWAACAIWACGEGDRAPPASDDFDPSVLDDGGAGMSPRVSPIGGRADAGTDGAVPGEASTEDAGADAAPEDDAQAPAEPGAVADTERLLIADGLQPLLYVYDVGQNTLLERIGIDARARVYAGADGRYGYALHSGGVDIVDMGLTRVATSSGTQLQLQAPVLLADRLLGAEPGALLARAGQVAVFFETEPKLEVLSESSLTGALQSQTLDVGAPHHGFGAPFGDGFIATRGEPGAVALRRYLASGVLDSTSSFDCVAPEGAALGAATLAVGCDGGVLLLDESGAAELVPYPAVGTARVRRLVAHPERAQFLALLGDQLCLVQSGGLTCSASPGPALDYGFDAGGKRALLLLSDGSMQVLDANGLSLQGELSVTSGVSSGDELMQPMLAVGRRFVYVSDPQVGRVQLVDPASRSLAGQLQVAGAPARLAVFGYRAPR